MVGRDPTTTIRATVDGVSGTATVNVTYGGACNDCTNGWQPGDPNWLTL